MAHLNITYPTETHKYSAYLGEAVPSRRGGLLHDTCCKGGEGEAEGKWGVHACAIDHES